MTRFLAIILVALTLVACKDGDRRRDRPRTEQPRQEQPLVGRVIEIPACGVGKAGYVTMKWAPPIAGTMRIAFTITGTLDARIVGHEQRDAQGRMHLFFQREGDDFSVRKYEAGYRQWSTAYSLLQVGDFELSVPLTADKWGNRAGFDAARENVENVGFTLGDNQAKGHGVCMAAGSASITVQAFSIGG